MRNLLVGLALLGLALLGLALPQAALADTTTLERMGAWETFAGPANDGTFVCGLSYSDDQRYFSFKWFEGRKSWVIQLKKPSWSIPEGTKVVFKINPLSGEHSYTADAEGVRQYVEATIGGAALQSLYQELRHDTGILDVSFPSGNEPAWRLPLAGMPQAIQLMSHCIRIALLVRGTTPRTISASPPAPAAPTSPAPTPTPPMSAAPPVSPGDEAAVIQ